jgi:hypothetical protein
MSKPATLFGRIQAPCNGGKFEAVVRHLQAYHLVSSIMLMVYSALPRPDSLRTSDVQYRKITRTPGNDDIRSFAVFERSNVHIMDQCLGVVTLLQVVGSVAQSGNFGEEVPVWNLDACFTNESWVQCHAITACQAAIEDLDSDLLGTKRGSSSLLSMRSALSNRKGVIRALLHPGNERCRTMCERLGFEEVGGRSHAGTMEPCYDTDRDRRFLLLEKYLEHVNAVSPLILYDDDGESI